MFDPKAYVQRVTDAANAILAALKLKRGDISVGLILGSGLTDLAGRIERPISISYSDIPGFPIPTAPGHKGVLIFGYIAGVPTLCFSGRTHYYEVAHEPYGMYEVIFATHVMASLGIRLCVTTNAVGGLNPAYAAGDLVFITDHDGRYFPNPLLGPNLDFDGNDYFQPQLPEQLHNRKLAALFCYDAGDDIPGSRIHTGIYVALTGRTYESPIECRNLRAGGADIVGMSTYPERVTAINRGMYVVSIAIVTNVIHLDGSNTASEQEVIDILTDEETRQKVSHTMLSFFTKLAEVGF